MKVIRKDITCRVGMNHSRLFISELSNLDFEIASAVCEQLGLEPEEIHRKTAIIKKIRPKCGEKDNKISLAGDYIVANKVLKLRLRIVMDECRLINDKEVKKTSVPNEPDNSDAE